MDLHMDGCGYSLSISTSGSARYCTGTRADQSYRTLKVFEERMRYHLHKKTGLQWEVGLGWPGWVLAGAVQKRAAWSIRSFRVLASVTRLPQTHPD